MVMILLSRGKNSAGAVGASGVEMKRASIPAYENGYLSILHIGLGVHSNQTRFATPKET